MPRIEVALAQRLEALTGEDAACCVDDYAATLKTIRERPSFEDGLKRAKAMGDEKRYTVLALLKARGEMCACEIQAALDLTHATVSHHMGILVEAELLTSEKRGKWAYYALTPLAKRLLP